MMSRLLVSRKSKYGDLWMALPHPVYPNALVHRRGLLRLVWSAYFDDFISVAPQAEAKATGSSIEMLFKLIAWTFAVSGDKAVDFASSFRALGIDVDVSHLHRGVVLLSNTEKHIAGLVQEFSQDTGRRQT